MKTVRVAEAEGAVLDWLVAKATSSLAPTGALWLVGNQLFVGVNGDLGKPGEWVLYQPSTNWAQGGPILERERIDVFSTANGTSWCAQADVRVFYGYGTTPLIAAMRCYILSKLGNIAEVPKQLT